MDPHARWQQFQSRLCACPQIGLTLDTSLMQADDAFFESMAPAIARAFDAMAALESGAIANPDENRMVGHYWLRAPSLAPSDDIRDAIRNNLRAVKSFALGVHSGRIAPPTRASFSKILSIGIGGSALGPMLVADALGDSDADRPEIHFLDNTDPDGIDRTLTRLGGSLDETLCLVISKSGSTPETRNGMILAARAWRDAGLDFARHAVAITGEDSSLDRLALSEGWLARFPMWDFVGGRTSLFSAVGLLPAALQGLDIDALLAGAAACDEATRNRDARKNPAALLSLLWHHATGGRGEKSMVILPYRDRLLLLSRYLQQLVMESLGKREDLSGHRVDQGLTVYGNKGSTDQHAYIQQLRDGRPDFFATFIRILEQEGDNHEVEPGITAGDYLHGFLLGTRQALADNGRPSMTLTLNRLDAFHLGVLVALFERAVGLYASLININAYHQPGVEAGKKAAAMALGFQRDLAARLGPTPRTALELATDLGRPADAPLALALLEHLAANGRARATGETPGEMRFSAAGGDGGGRD